MERDRQATTSGYGSTSNVTLTASNSRLSSNGQRLYIYPDNSSQDSEPSHILSLPDLYRALQGKTLSFNRDSLVGISESWRGQGHVSSSIAEEDEHILAAPSQANPPAYFAAPPPLRAGHMSRAHLGGSIRRPVTTAPVATAHQQWKPSPDSVYRTMMQKDYSGEENSASRQGAMQQCADNSLTNRQTIAVMKRVITHSSEPERKALHTTLLLRPKYDDVRLTLTKELQKSPAPPDQTMGWGGR